MATKFISDLGELDLSKVNYSIQEENSRVNDQQFTKFMFPFETYATDEFLTNYGDYASYNSANLRNKISGYLLIENKCHEAILYIESIIGKKITCQIDYGLEEIPNFNKKLSELPLENFKVDDIHTFAKDICKLTYPYTNFNFPRIYTTQYPTTDEVWKNFDGYLNDLKKDGSEMRRNYIDGEGNIFNINIIHPCPHILYLLKKGFEDAGYKLSGDILTDPNLINKWVYSGTEAFTSKLQRRYGFDISSDMPDELYLETGPDDYCKYIRDITIVKPGIYKIAGLIKFFRARKMFSVYQLKLNGNIIWEINQKAKNTTEYLDINMNMDINVTEENSVLQFYCHKQYHDWVFKVADLSITSNVIEDISLPEEQSNVITNLNEINLKKTVPEMTFGEMVNILKNWFNYDLDPIDKTIVMNRIGDKEPTNIKNLQFLEVPEPKINLLNRKSYLLKVVDLDEGNLKNSMYYDADGALLNGTEKTDTKVININGYLMPIKAPKANGYITANCLKNSTDVLALVEYEGLLNGQNNATYSTGCDFPELFYNNWEKHLRLRVNGKEFNWTKNANIANFNDFTIKNYIFAYNNIHIVKSINKDKISEFKYRIEIITETIT